MEFRLLGPVEAWDDEGRRLDLGARQQRFVLAVLLLEANHVVPASRLVGLLWPDDPPRSARQSIQVRVSRLRGLLGASVPVVSEGAGYRIRIDPLAVDAHRFRARVGAARGAVEDGDDDRAVRLFREALDLWSGEPLAGTASEEVRLQLSHGLEEARLVAVEDCLDAELRLGRHASVLDELTDLVRTHPTRERLVGQLMLGLHRCGQTARALEIARQTRELLADELGIDPGAKLRDLELAILRDDPSLLVRPPHHTERSTTAGANGSTTAGGNGTAPEPATNPAAADEPGNLSPQTPPPAQLPPAGSAFTGRRAQLRELDRYLSATADDAAAARLVVVSGMGGLGKTTLALHWAHQVAHRLPDGQLYIDLRGHAAVPAVRPIEALAHFLLGLGFEPARIPGDLDAATAAYRTALAGRSVLVVLDNAADPAQVRPLLPAAPGCLTLVTSRDRLSGLVARDGAHRLALDTLTTEEAIELLEKLLGPARAATEADAVAELAKVCARLPLALRIAAGFLTDNPRHSIHAYVDQLHEGDLLDTLTVDGDDDAAIRATFDLSYQRLADPERRMFRLLGLVPGPDVTPGAAAALAAVPVADVGRQLARLCTSHLLTEHVPGRFMLHDLLREYARGRAETDEPAEDRAEAFNRLMAWYYLNARNADVCLSPTLIRLPLADVPDGVPTAVAAGDTDAALRWFASEDANLRSALTHCAEHGPHRWVWLIAELERHHLTTTGDRVAHQTITNAAVAAAEHCGDPAALNSAYLGYANTLARHDPSRARDVLTKAIRHAERVADPLWLASTLNDLAGIHVRLGDYGTAHSLLCRSVTETKRSGSAGVDPVRTLSNFGLLAAIRGNLHEGAASLREAARAYEELGADRSQAYALISLAEVTHALGDAKGALVLLDRAAALARASGSHRLVEARIERAVALTELGRLDAAEAEVAGLVESAEGTEDPELVARAYAARGNVRRRLPDQELARRDHARAVQVATASKDQYLTMRALVGLAWVEAAHDRDEDAAEHAGAALAMAQRSGARIVEGDALTVLATVERRRGDTAAAVSWAEAALAVHRRTDHHLGKARALKALGLALRECSPDAATRDRAEACLGEAYELFDSFGSYEAETVP